MNPDEHAMWAYRMNLLHDKLSRAEQLKSKAVLDEWEAKQVAKLVRGLNRGGDGKDKS